MFILTLTLSQALIALSGHRQAMIAWAVRTPRGDAASPRVPTHDLFLRVEAPAQSPVPGVSAAAMGWFFVQRLKQGVSAGSLASLVEQIEYGPLENSRTRLPGQVICVFFCGRAGDI